MSCMACMPEEGSCVVVMYDNGAIRRPLRQMVLRQRSEYRGGGIFFEISILLGGALRATSRDSRKRQTPLEHWPRLSPGGVAAARSQQHAEARLRLHRCAVQTFSTAVAVAVLTWTHPGRRSCSDTPRGRPYRASNSAKNNGRGSAWMPGAGGGGGVGILIA